MKYRCNKVKERLNKFSFYYCNPHIPVHTRLHVYKTCLLPSLLYAIPILKLSAEEDLLLERVQRLALKKILGVNTHTATAAIEGDTGLGSLQSRRDQARAKFAAKTLQLDRNSLVSTIFRYIPDTLPPTRRSRLQCAGSTAAPLRRWFKDVVRQASPEAGSTPKQVVSSREQARWSQECSQKRTLTSYRTVKHKVSPEPYLRILHPRLARFLFQLRADVLPTSEALSRGRPDSPLCKFCAREPETLEHLFFTCTDVSLHQHRTRLHHRLHWRVHKHTSGRQCGLEKLLKHTDNTRRPTRTLVKLAWNIWKHPAVLLTDGVLPQTDANSPPSPILVASPECPVYSESSTSSTCGVHARSPPPSPAAVAEVSISSPPISFSSSHPTSLRPSAVYLNRICRAFRALQLSEPMDNNGDNSSTDTHTS